jgi:tetratricopeptide (TPR) repeat protein
VKRRVLPARALLPALLAGLMSVAGTSAAQDIEQAKRLFNAGAAAYASGQFGAAIQAFEEANKIVAKPAIVFSIAQAHKRQYAIDHNPEHLRAAIDHYRSYIEQVPQGGRRADAAQALGELEQMAGRPAAPDSAKVAGPMKEPARIMVMTQAENAEVLLDGKTKKEAQLAVEVSPGKHRIKVSAAGYFDDERDVTAVDNNLVPVDVQLREKPAQLSVEGTKNADVTVDSRTVGTTPLPGPIQLTSGSHLIVIRKNGYKAYAEEIEVTRDQRKTLKVALRATGQRIVAESLLLSAGTAVIGGVVFTLVAGSQQHQASVILEKQKTQTLTNDDKAAYYSARDSRDNWVKVAAISYGVGAAALVTGLVFYAFDQPSVALAPQHFDDKPKKPLSPREPTEMSMRPIIAPGFAGGAFTGRF